MKKSLINEVRRFKKIAGILKENLDPVAMYDEAIHYAHEMTPEIMYQDGEFGDDVESILQAEDEFRALLAAEEINPASTKAYDKYFETALSYAKSKDPNLDVEDFKIWFQDTAIESSAYQSKYQAGGSEMNH